jgi:hypothetical protein
LGFAQRNDPCCSHKLHLQTTMPCPTTQNKLRNAALSKT